MSNLLDDESARRSSARQDRQVLANGNEAPIHIEAQVSALYYLAAAHRSPVRGVKITNLALPSAAGSNELVLTCHVESALGESLFEPRALAFPLPAQGVSIPFQTFQLNPNRRVLAMLEERIQAQVVMTVRRGDEVVGALRKPIEFLAHNQWMHEDSYFDSLAAFVHPNSRSIDNIISRARELLEQKTGRGSTEGYQSVGREPERVHQMAAAVFDALRELKLAYTNPPTGFEGFGQKVRTPEDITAASAATCIDSAVLYV